MTIRDLDAAGDLIATAVAAGGDEARVQAFRLALDDETEILARARSAAFDDARARAEQYAALADRELGELLAVSEIVGAPGPGPTPDVAPEVADEAAAAPPVEPGEQARSVRLQVIWRLD